MSLMPPQHPPVKRPDVIYPHRSIDCEHGNDRDVIKVRMDLMHGANYNDPTYYRQPSYQDMIPSALVSLAFGLFG